MTTTETEITDPVYEEIHVARATNHSGPAFPTACPVCGSEVAGGENGGTPWATQIYACGGRYEPKPQIQNHTDKWWGLCQKARRCNRVGLVVTVPEDVLKDAEIDAGLRT